VRSKIALSGARADSISAGIAALGGEFANNSLAFVVALN
jgi:hypothetical protein